MTEIRYVKTSIAQSGFIAGNDSEIRWPQGAIRGCRNSSGMDLDMEVVTGIRKRMKRLQEDVVGEKLEIEARNNAVRG